MCVCVYIYIYIYIKSSHANSTDYLKYLVIHFYWPSFLAGPLDGTQCPHRTDQSKLLLVG